jgi:hypothetical protein
VGRLHLFEVNPNSSRFFKAFLSDAGAHRYFAIACLLWIILCPLLSFTIGHDGYGGGPAGMATATNFFSLLIGLVLVLPSMGFCALFWYGFRKAGEKDRRFLATLCLFGLVFACCVLLLSGWFYCEILTDGML